MIRRRERRRLESQLPNLRRTGYSVTSEADRKYNCIAWAVNDNTRWWWPSQFYYWPPGAPVEESLAAFIRTFETLGYEVCDDGEWEEGVEKVARR